MTKEKRVGIFVAVGILILALGVFLIGENRKFWSRKVTYNAVYSDVAGLRPGSPVSMGGVDVGTVAKVKYSDDPKDAHIYVTIDIVRSQAERIRKPVYDETGKKVVRKGTVASIVCSSQTTAPRTPLTRFEPFDDRRTRYASPPATAMIAITNSHTGSPARNTKVPFENTLDGYLNRNSNICSVSL